MKARRVVWPEPGKVELEEFETPSLSEGRLLIETERTVVSPGTELAYLRGAENTARRFPHCPGYSGAGRVLEIGPGVEGFKPGERVVMDHCGHASHALVSVEGWRGQGLTKIESEKVSSSEAAFLPIASMALQGVRKLRPELGESFLVAGLGLLGLFAIRFASLSGVYPLVALDFNPARRALALDFGADLALSPDDPALVAKIEEATGGCGVDALVEVTGAASALPGLLPLMALRGRVSLLGCARGLTDGVDFYHDVHKKGVTIIGAHNYIRPEKDSTEGFWTGRADFKCLLDLIRLGRLDVKSLISEELAPSQAPEAYRRLGDARNGLLGVVFNWSQGKA